MFYTYIIRGKNDGKWYTGFTNDLRKRFREHNDNKVFSAKNRGPFELIYYEACMNEQDAVVRGKYLKSGMGKRYIKNRLKRFLSLTGFTLIEVLLALFITAILITILSIVFNTGLRSYRQGKDLLEITRKGQLVLGQITRELVGAMVQEDYIPFEGTGNSIFFMAPVENNSDLDLCEIGYLVEDDGLKRHFLTYGRSGFEYPGSVNYNSLSAQPFCDKVTGFNLKYDGDPNWSDRYNLPKIVEISVRIEGKYGNPPQKKTFTTWIYLPNSTNN